MILRDTYITRSPPPRRLYPSASSRSSSSTSSRQASPSSRLTFPSTLILATILLLSLPTALAQNESNMEGTAADNVVEGKLWIVIVDIVFLASTILGASTILLSMFYSEYILKRASTVRTRMVQGLVISDLFLGVFALIPTAAYLGGKNPIQGTAWCDGFGFLLVAVLMMEHCWTFSLAFSTYMILIYPLHGVTRFLEKYWFSTYFGIWVLATVFGILAYYITGYYPTGGICYYGPNPRLYSELAQFIPRAFVFIGIAFFYSRLYVFLKRPDKLRASFSPSPVASSKGYDANGRADGMSSTSSSLSVPDSGNVSEGERERRMNGNGHGPETWTGASFSNSAGRTIIGKRLRKRSKDASKDISDSFKKFSFKPRERLNSKEVEMHGNGNGHGHERAADLDQKKKVEDAERHGVKPKDFAEEEKSPGSPQSPALTVRANGSGGFKSDRWRSSQKTCKPSDDVPPWERMELPSFQIDGQKYGGATAAASPIKEQGSQFWPEWKVMGRKRGMTGGTTGSTSSRPTSPTVDGRQTFEIPTRRERNHSRETSASERSIVATLLEGRRESVRRDSVQLVSIPTSVKEEMTPMTMITSPSPTSSFTQYPSPKSPSCTVFGNPRPHPGNLDFPKQRGSITSTDPVSPGSYPPIITSTTEILTPGASPYAPTWARNHLQTQEQDSAASRKNSYTSPSDTESRRGSGPVSFILPPPMSKRDPIDGTDADDTTQTPDKRSVRSGGSDRNEKDSPKTLTNNSDIERGLKDEVDDEDEDSDMDFNEFLRHESEDDPDAGDAARNRQASSDSILVQESTASYLNRKTAMLMLYFPLAYCALFSVSVIRLIYDFASKDTPMGLRAVSRWFIFAQGLVDAFIYGFVEWNTKRIVRRKVKKGQITPHMSKRSWQAGVTAEEMLASKKPSKGQEKGSDRGGSGGLSVPIRGGQLSSLPGIGEKRMSGRGQTNSFPG